MRDVPLLLRQSLVPLPSLPPPTCQSQPHGHRVGTRSPARSWHRQQPGAGSRQRSPARHSPASPPHRGANPSLSWVRDSGCDPKLLLTNQTIKTHSRSQEISLHQLLIYGVTGVSGLKAAKSHQRATPTQRWVLENNHKHASEEAAWDAIP